ncbi:mRNA export factor GLE1-like [Saccostrea echinata]|uniref:mRNA export factor GLE1-like n=1 Tax=Saccostrea echinata TaxID=191078 RepID=UPI002A8048CF|nr:mRNA export factor GLE1-like [Saccostrea echinata]
MSHNGRGRFRPLGSIRANLKSGGSEKIPHIPSASSVSSKVNLEKDNQGILGNALAVPPVKEKKEEKVKVQSAKSDSGSSTKSQESEYKKELQDAKAREKDLLKEIAELKKLIEELRKQIQEGEQTITSLRSDLKTQEETLTGQINKEKSEHEATKQSLQGARSEIDELRAQIEKLRKENEEQIDRHKKELEEKILEITTSKDKEIKIRDEKLTRLKNQMADALKGNSWERQQQLEELTKELARIQEECDALRMKLKASKSKGGHCANCQDMTAKLEKFNASIKEKDQTIKELKSLCARFEKQLTQQDYLLKQWAESKGHKVK